MRCILVLLLLCPCHPAGALSLSELEGEIDAGLAIRIAEVEVDRAGHVLAGRKSERGFKVLSNVALSDNVEPSDVGGTRAFRALSAQLGFRYPLLGSRWREEVAELGAATEAAVAEIRRDVALRQALLSLRLSYLDYWLAERKAALSAEVLRREPEARRTLDQRRDAGLLLESDRRELMTAFALARRNQARARTTADDALARVNLLTGRSRVPFPAEFPKLPAACHDAAAFPAVITDTHPELAVLKAIAEAKADRVNFAASAPIESGVNLAQSVVYESTDQSGYGTVLSFDMRMPLDFVGASRAIRDQAAAARIKAGLELELRHRELGAEALRTLGAYEARQAQIAFLREREAAAEEAVRERDLRAAAGLPGDVYEKLEQARIEEYRVALKAAAAQAGLAIEETRLLALAPQGCGARLAHPPRGLKDRRPRVDHSAFVPPLQRTIR
ncbi:MAG: TolC family protein [Gammaproteobacteria bacterium]